MAKIDQVLNKLAVMDERDVNTAKDIEAIHKTLTPLVERVQRLNQTVYGENGNNGINSDVKLLKRAFIGAQAIVVLAGGALMMFKEQVLSFLVRK